MWSGASISMIPRWKNGPIIGSHPSSLEKAFSRFIHAHSIASGPTRLTTFMPIEPDHVTGPKRSKRSIELFSGSANASSVLPINGSPAVPITGLRPEPAGGSASGRGGLG